MVYVVTGTHFRALRAHGACEAGFFFMANFVLPRRFHRGITHPHTPTHGQKTPDGRTETLMIFIYSMIRLKFKKLGSFEYCILTGLELSTLFQMVDFGELLAIFSS